MKYFKRKISKSGNLQHLVEVYHDPHFVQAMLAQLPWWHHLLLLEKVKKPKVQTLSAQISWSYNIIRTNFQTFGVHGLTSTAKSLKQIDRETHA